MSSLRGAVGSRKRPESDSTLETFLQRVAERPRLIVAACVVLAVAVNLWVTRGQTLYSDEWNRLFVSDSFESLLRGHSGHLVVLHALLYKAMFGLFGADTYVPFRVVEASLVGVCGLLFYALARGSSGPWSSLAATVVLLFLGSAFEVIATPYGIVILLPMAFGLGALVCLRRFPKDGDPLVCVLLIAAVASQSIGLAFIVGVAAILAQQDPRRLVARAWVVLVPGLLYAGWYAWSRLTAPPSFPHPVELSNVGQVPSTVVAVCAAGLSAVSGLFGGSGPVSDGNFASFNLEAGYLLLGLLAIVVVWRVRSGSRLRREIWVPVALALTFWALVGMTNRATHPPEASRYIYPSAVFLLLFVLELASGVRATSGVLLLTALAVTVSLVPNLVNLSDQARRIRDVAGSERSELAALEVLRSEVPATAVPPLTFRAGVLQVGGQGPPIPAADYFEAIDRYGSPAFTPSQLATASESKREAADEVLLKAGDLRALRVPGGRLPKPHDCRDVSARIFRVPAAGLVLEPAGKGSSVTVNARRFATEPQPVRVAAGSGPVVLGTRASRPPWLVMVSGANVCRPR